VQGARFCLSSVSQGEHEFSCANGYLPSMTSDACCMMSGWWLGVARMHALICRAYATCFRTAPSSGSIFATACSIPPDFRVQSATRYSYSEPSTCLLVGSRIVLVYYVPLNEQMADAHLLPKSNCSAGVLSSGPLCTNAIKDYYFL
jgi:hypothetical protein